MSRAIPKPEKKPPAFYCPDCGQKHRADLSVLEGRPGAVMKASCKGCGHPLGVSLGGPGGVTCVRLTAEAAVEKILAALPAKAAGGAKSVA